MSCCVQDSGVNNCLSWHPTGENIFLDPQDIFIINLGKSPKQIFSKAWKVIGGTSQHIQSKKRFFFFLYFLFPAEPVSNSSRRSTGANNNSRCSNNVSQRFTQASPNPAKNKVKTCYPLRKDSGAVLCSSFDVGTPSSSDIKKIIKKTAATTASALISLAAARLC